jgi:hypothetical protein
VLDTSTVMTETDFASKIARDVKQTFVLTFSRLFETGAQRREYLVHCRDRTSD